MGRIITKRLLIIVCMLFCMGIAGCSGNAAKGTEEEEKTGQNPAAVPEAEEKGENIYIPEYVMLPEYATLGRIHIGNDTVYFAASEYQQDGSLNNGIYRLKINESEPVRLDFQFDTDENIQCMSTDEEGNFYFVTGNERQDQVDKTEKYIKLMKIDNNGKVLDSFDITSYFSGQTFKRVDFMEADGEGNIILNGEGSSSLVILDKKGALLFECQTGGMIMGMCSSHGKTYVAYHTTSGVEAAEIDMDSKGLGSKYEKIGNAGSLLNSFHMIEAAEDTLLINSGGMVYEYDMRTEEQYKLFNWLGCDMDGNKVSGIKKLEDGRIFAVSISYSRSMEGTAQIPEFIFLRKAKEGEDPNAGKETLKVYTIIGDMHIVDEAVRFNKSHAGYRIEMEVPDGRFLTESINRLNAEIADGKGPDIIVFSMGSDFEFSEFSAETYAKKGALENLYDYIDEDDTLKREDLIENIIRAFETDGKLCVIPLSFLLDTMLGRTSEVGSSMGWNLDEMIAYANGKGSGAEIFGGVRFREGMGTNLSAKKQILDICIKANMDGLIGENGFNREFMIKVLEFSNQMTDYEKSSYPSPDFFIQNEEMYLLKDNSSPYPGAYVELNMQFNEPLTFIGYPTEKGTGSFAASRVAVGINVNCKHKEVAWEFIRTFLTKEYQIIPPGWGIPVLKEAVERYYEDSIEILVERNASLTADAAAKEMETVTEMIAGIESVALDTPVHAIIREEADYYFNGFKTAEETADIIASRVMLYVNENR